MTKLLFSLAVNLLEGTFELEVHDERLVLTPGMVATLDPHVSHAGRAITDCRIIDVFSPVREDYLSFG